MGDTLPLPVIEEDDDDCAHRRSSGPHYTCCDYAHCTECPKNQQ